MKHKTITVQVRPCPCCGSGDLDVGVQSAQSYGVRCRSCRLLMARYTPDKWPKGVWKRKLGAEENFARLAEYVLNQAVAAWNQRPLPGELNVRAQVIF